jgi:hypothetical protein
VRKCSNCGGSGPFGRSKTAKDGLKSHCKECCAKKQTAYRTAHPEVWASWAATNAEHLKSKDAARYAADPEGAKVRTRSWQLRNPEKFKANMDRGNLKKYGLTPEDKQAVFEKQKGKCPICTGLLRTGRTGMQVDHEHASGRVRGLLCAHCNLMLGDFQESPTRFEAAVHYLQRGLVKGLTLTVRPKGVGWASRGTRAGNLWYFYGLTEQTFQELLDRQEGGCGICRDPLVPGSGTHIDHAHTLGKKQGLRGLLCRACNLGLGHARENKGTLVRAVAYLAEHGSN